MRAESSSFLTSVVSPFAWFNLKFKIGVSPDELWRFAWKFNAGYSHSLPYDAGLAGYVQR